MNPEDVVKSQMEAYNRRNLEEFAQFFSPSIQCFLLPSTEPFIHGLEELRERYKDRFKADNLHAKCLSRIAFRDYVVEHELVTGIGPDPVEALVTYRVEGEQITRIWFAGL